MCSVLMMSLMACSSKSGDLTFDGAKDWASLSAQPTASPAETIAPNVDDATDPDAGLSAPPTLEVSDGIPNLRSDPELSPFESPIEVTEEPDFVMPQPLPFAQGEIITEYGVQIHGCGPNPEASVKAARDLGFTWIKQQVRWGDMSPRKGVMNWECLDRVMAASQIHRMKVLLSLTTAPRYYREMRDVQGFPDDLSHFAYYVNDLLSRYPNQVHGLEIWNEPNIDAEVSEGINYARYDLLQALGFAIAKSHNSNMLVISAGLAPVDTESFFTRISDTEFLKNIFERGALEHVDCIGAHANGPDGRGIWRRWPISILD
ncbi:MAG: hypothetical protein HC853_00055 [Anaerolineae bacterium]|nr:hypothetical protein [Anaerolineae bacterium]